MEAARVARGTAVGVQAGLGRATVAVASREGEVAVD